MRDTPADSQRTVVTLVNGEIRCDTQISFSSVSLVDGEIRVHRAEGNQIEVPVPGADFALRFDLQGMQKVPEAPQTPVEPVPADDSLKLFNSKTVWVTLALWFFVSSVFGWLGIVVAVGYFAYHWRQVTKRKEQLAKATVLEPMTRSSSGMSPESVRNALARKR
ncbi:hypothetical protein [Pseudomonas triticicola]|uniref:hypothetical protein n=1 Tax=Pseudomonas triticicola TaxID=2842345 RepID=UPI003EBD3EF1